MGYHENAVTKEQSQTFREMCDWLRNEAGMSWGQIAQTADIAVERGGGGNGAGVVHSAYVRKPTYSTFESVLKLYVARRKADEYVRDKARDEVVLAETATELSPERRLLNVLHQYPPGLVQTQLIKKAGHGAGLGALRRLIRSGVVVVRQKGKSTSPKKYYLAAEAPPEGEATAAAGTVVAPPVEAPGPTLGAKTTPDPTLEALRGPTATTDSWEVVRNDLLRVAERIAHLGDSIDLSGHPEVLRKEIAALFRRRHDRLLTFIEEELEG
jgi:hypothetical protein